MNVLLSCAGRRNYLVRFFQEALNGRGKVLVTDASATAPVMAEGDLAFVMPRITASDYFDKMLALCVEQNVGLMLSLNDLALPKLARQRQRFAEAGVQVVVSSPEVIDMCADKVATAQFLSEHGIPTPTTYVDLGVVGCALKAGEIRFPLVVKARWGSGSIGLEFVDNEEQLHDAFRYVDKRVRRSFLAELATDKSEPCVVIQPRLAGEEFHLDVINDLKGNYRATLAKKKLAMRAGETDKATTIYDPELSELGARLGHCLGHLGVLDCDVFSDPSGYNVIDLNPRFGGGYPFSQAAGANVPAALVAWANGSEADPQWLQVKPGVSSAKCDRLVVCRSE